MVASFSFAFWSRARYPFGFDAGAAALDGAAAEAGFAVGGVAFLGGAAALAGAVVFFATVFAAFVDDGAAVPRYGTDVVEV